MSYGFSANDSTAMVATKFRAAIANILLFLHESTILIVCRICASDRNGILCCYEGDDCSKNWARQQRYSG